MSLNRVAAVVLAGLCTMLLVAARPKSVALANNQPTPATTTIYNCAPTGPYSIQNDPNSCSPPNSVSYTSGNGVASYDVQNSLEFFLADSSPAQFLTLTLGSGAPNGIYKPKVFSGCFDSNDNPTVLPGPGASNNKCRLRVEFDNYILLVSPIAANTPGVTTGTAQWTCVSPTSGSTCSSWAITPFSNPPGGAVLAALYEVVPTGHGNKVESILVGSFNINFQINFAIQ